MQFRTIVDIPAPAFQIPPFARMLFVGSCFATGIGQRFVEDKFHATVNPFGVMYNPASIVHTVERWLPDAPAAPDFVFLTLGTNHIYLLRETGEIVDNCQKKPQKWFEERVMDKEECAGWLRKAVKMLVDRNPLVKVIMTVSPIRYAKYGFHGSALSKATLLLAADTIVKEMPGVVTYFPAYEILCDELRDYRFYQPDMIHPSDQTVEYIWQRLTDTYLNHEAKTFICEWQHIKEARAHRPFHPESEAYQAFLARTDEMEKALRKKYPQMDGEGGPKPNRGGGGVSPR